MKASNAKQITSQHFEHRVWRNELNFFADELKIYEHQLEELVGKGIKEMMPRLEHFQNSFIRQKEVLDELNHDINVHEQALAYAMSNDTDETPAGLYNHDESREKFETFKSIYADLKADFMQFLRKWH
ncbi:MAG: hypothetical protein KDC24_13135 [Saprospiraceae bacterium]|nr:hypothetical protein [Saprospiraceae bacterium]